MQHKGLFKNVTTSNRWSIMNTSKINRECSGAELWVAAIYWVVVQLADLWNILVVFCVASSRTHGGRCKQGESKMIEVDEGDLSEVEVIIVRNKGYLVEGDSCINSSNCVVQRRWSTVEGCEMVGLVAVSEIDGMSTSLWVSNWWS